MQIIHFFIGSHHHSLNIHNHSRPSQVQPRSVANIRRSCSCCKLELEHYYLSTRALSMMIDWWLINLINNSWILDLINYSNVIFKLLSLTQWVTVTNSLVTQSLVIWKKKIITSKLTTQIEHDVNNLLWSYSYRIKSFNCIIYLQKHHHVCAAFHSIHFSSKTKFFSQKLYWVLSFPVCVLILNSKLIHFPSFTNIKPCL